MLNNKELKFYYKEVSSALICSQKQKKAFMNDFKSEVEDYLSAYPQADIDNIKAEFGTAGEIASSFIMSSDTAEIKKKLDIRKLLIIAVATALVLYLIFVVTSLIDVHTEAHGYIQESIMMINTIMGGELL